jgi:hypothetical protein
MSFVAIACHLQPAIGEAPAQQGILLAVVDVAMDLDAVDLLDVVGEETSNLAM